MIQLAFEIIDEHSSIFTSSTKILDISVRLRHIRTRDCS
jgi:hypothetical protein